MSLIGNKPIPIPAPVKIEIAGKSVKVSGPKGNLSLEVRPEITVSQEGSSVYCKRQTDDRLSRSLHGLYRSLISNMVDGVTKGFERKLEIVGVGFGGKLEGKFLSLTVGFANSVKVAIPEGVTVTLPDATHIIVSGADKQKVGQFAAEVRAVRKPEPYKGTGIKYDGEHIRRKAGKAFGSGG